jgi:hypothetical protein
MIPVTASKTASLQVLTTGDPNQWCAFLPAGRSVFGSVEFASISEQHLGYISRLFVFTKDGETITYPLFLRSVSGLPFVTSAQSEAWDSLSPEYTGPRARGSVTQATASSFRKCFADYCQRERIVAEFAHLHPWKWSADLLAKEGVFLDREIVYVDLTLPEERIWQDSFTYACRKNIKRSLKENVRVFLASTPGDIHQFYRIYSQTMDRRSALSKYRFPLSYFMAFFEQMPDNAAYFLAEYNNQIVAATLYLHDDDDIYSYLGGADHSFQHVRPANAVVHEAIRWARSQGKKRLILGGGYQPDDGIFRFKASFSPLRVSFYVYKRIHLPDEYDAFCRAWSTHYRRSANIVDGYFPAYRSVPVTTEHDELVAVFA